MRLRWPWMGSLPRPQRSLSGRVIGTLLVTFVLVWLLLLGRDWLNYQQTTRHMHQMQDAAQTLVDLLPTDPEATQWVMRSSELQYNALRRRAQKDSGGPILGDVLFVLSRASDGRELYASAGWRSEGVPPQNQSAMTVMVSGMPYWSVQAVHGQRRLRFLAPALSTSTILQIMAAELTLSMLMALPLVALPVGWAVRHGLRPLRQLSVAVCVRRNDDFKPLQLDLRYAELQPLLTAFNTLLAQSAQAVARERAFVQDAAHELRTPLAVIGAQAHALSQSATGSEEHRLALAQLERAIARASHQVHQLLTLARLDGASQRAAETLDLVGEVRDALIAAAPRAQSRGVELSLDAPESLHLQLDRVALHSVIDNLLSNAVTWARLGGRVQVQVRVQPPGSLASALGHWQLMVNDDGPGLAEADRHRVFERFQRGAGSADASGCGLGLAIVRQAARQLGGDVAHGPGLDGAGAGFVVTCPMVQQRQPART